MTTLENLAKPTRFNIQPKHVGTSRYVRMLSAVRHAYASGEPDLRSYLAFLASRKHSDKETKTLVDNLADAVLYQREQQGLLRYDATSNMIYLSIPRD